MSVVSFEFLGFLLALAMVYYVLPMRVRKWALLLGSAGFWLSCGLHGTAYLLAETLLIWGCARLMGRFGEKKGVRTALLIGGLVTALGAMVLLKVAAQAKWLPQGLLLPVGLSYFTFQSVGYLLDVHRGKVTPEKNYAKVLLFAGFFPQLTQGPITTWKQLMPQLDTAHRLSPAGIVSAVYLMAWGMFKKLVLADRMMPTVGRLVATAQEQPGWLVLATAAIYAIALYADFSGGIDIIRGASELFGIELPENFRRPFFAMSVADYWRRWHISLGVWFRTYLLYPLVASRAGIALAKVGKRLFGAKAGRAMPGAVASIVVFLLIGVWHGFYWNAVIYGLWFGLLTAAGMLLDPIFRKLRKRVTAHRGGQAALKAWGWLRTMGAVLLAQFFACTTSPSMAFGMIGRIFTDFAAPMSCDFPLSLPDGIVAIAAVLMMLLVDVCCEKQPELRKKLAVLPLYVRWPLLMGLMFLTLIFGRYGAGFDRAAFLYAGF